MAPTVDLLAAKRAEQVAIARAVQRQTALLWRLLPASDLSGDRAALWAAAQAQAVFAGRRAAALSAAKWYRRMRLDDVGEALPVSVAPDLLAAAPDGSAVPSAVLNVAPDVAQAVANSLRVTGPVRVKQAITAGDRLDDALAKGLRGVTGSTQRHVLDAGRDADLDLMNADPLVTYYERVASASACNFCKMLAGRGAVYTLESGSFKSHDHCACGIRPVFQSEARRRVRSGRSKVTVYRNRVDLPKKPDAPAGLDLELARMNAQQPGMQNRPTWLGDNVKWHGERDQRMITREAEYERIPQDVREAVAAQGVTVHFTDGPVTSVWEWLKGVRPRGWPKGSSWDDVSGGYNTGMRQAVFGQGRDGSASMVAHEFGHAVDDALAAKIGAERLSAKRAYALAHGKVTWTNRYFAQAGPAGKQEAFAELFAIGVVNPDDASALAALAKISSTPEAALHLLKLGRSLVKEAMDA